LSEQKSALDEVLAKIDAIQRESQLVEETKRLIDNRENNSASASRKDQASVVDEDLFDKIKTNKVVQPEPEKAEDSKEKSAIRRLLDEDEDDNEEGEGIDSPSALYDDPLEEIEDFEHEDDRDEIYRDLKMTVGKMAVKQFAFFLLSLASLYLFIGGFKPVLIGGGADAAWYKVAFLIVDTLCWFLSFGVFGQGIKKLLRAKADTDTMLALLAVSVSTLRIISLVNSSMLPYHFSLEPFLALGLFFNVVAKKKIASNIKRNFKSIASGEEKLTVSVPVSCENNNALILETGEGGDVMYAHKTRLVTKFIEHSYSDFNFEHKMEHFQFCCLVIVCVLTVLVGQLTGWKEAIMFPAVSLAVSVPFFSRLYYGIAVYAVGKKVRKNGGILTSIQAAKSLADGDLVVISEEDFIGDGSVLLQGIRAMGEMQIDDLITNIAALFNHVGTPMQPLFAKMIDSKTVSLPRVDDIYYHEGMGYSCLIHSKMFLVGNRKLMEHFNISFPQSLMMLELKDGHFPVYVSYHKSAAGIFLASYERKNDILAATEMAGDEFIGLGIVSNNFLFDKTMLKNLYPSVNSDFVHLISSKTGVSSRPLLAAVDKSDDPLASVNGCRGLIAGLLGGRKLLLSLKITRIIKILYLLISLALIFFIALAGYSANTTWQMMIFQLIWFLPTWVICSFCK